MAFEPPARVSHFQVGEPIGGGAMGVVFHGTDLRDGSAVAIKFLSPDLVRMDPSFAERFEQEAHVASLLRSPYTVKLVDSGIESGTPYLVMEYVAGQTMAEAMAAGALPLERVLRIGRDVARALEEASARDVVHRDIKPANILLSSDGRTKVTDFGIARIGGGTILPGAAHFLGTPAYAPPEQKAGLSDHRSDLYSLGATLAVALTGSATPTDRQLEALPASVAGILRRCLEADPLDRYQSATALAGALERAWNQLSGSARQPQPPADSEATVRRPVAAPPVPAAAPAAPESTAAFSPATIAVPQPPAPPPEPTEVMAQRAAPPGRPAAAATGGAGNRRALLYIGGAVVALVALLGGLAAAGVFGGDDDSPPVSDDDDDRDTPTRRRSTATPTRERVTNTPRTSVTPTTAVPTADTRMRFEAGEWTFNFVIVEWTCGGGVNVGDTFTLVYTFAEADGNGDGFVDDGENVDVYRDGIHLELVRFRWPNLGFRYATVTGGTVVVTTQFKSPNSGIASRSETRPFGNSTCSGLARDNG